MWTQQMATQIKDLCCISDCLGYLYSTNSSCPFSSSIGLVTVTPTPRRDVSNNTLLNYSQHVVISHMKEQHPLVAKEDSSAARHTRRTRCKRTNHRIKQTRLNDNQINGGYYSLYFPFHPGLCVYSWWIINSCSVWLLPRTSTINVITSNYSWSYMTHVNDSSSNYLSVPETSVWTYYLLLKWTCFWFTFLLRHNFNKLYIKD